MKTGESAEDSGHLVAVRAIMWGFAGLLFSAVFLGAWRYLGLDGAAWWHLPAAAAAAGAFVAGFYSAKRAAIAGAVAGTISSQVMLIYFPSEEGPLNFILATFLAGLVIGVASAGIYERRRGALAVVFSGGVAGTVAGVVLGLPVLLLPPSVRPLVIPLLLVPGTGVLFYLVALRASFRGHPASIHFVPHALSVGLASAWISTVVGASMWFLALSLSYDITAEMKEAIQVVFGQIPLAMLGGVLGGAAAGATLELARVRWIARV